MKIFKIKKKIHAESKLSRYMPYNIGAIIDHLKIAHNISSPIESTKPRSAQIMHSILRRRTLF